MITLSNFISNKCFFLSFMMFLWLLRFIYKNTEGYIVTEVYTVKD
jgi:hypothetical protein